MVHRQPNHITELQTITTSQKKSIEAKRNSSVLEVGHSASEDEDMDPFEPHLYLIDREISEQRRINNQCDNELDNAETLDSEVFSIEMSIEQLPALVNSSNSR